MAAMSAKQEILRRIRSARGDLADQSPGTTPIPRRYQVRRDVPEGLIERFRERVVDYRAEVDVVPADGVGAGVAGALARLGASRVGVPAGLPSSWLPDGVQVHRDAPSDPLGLDALQALHAVVTGCAVGIAETGTVVLDGRPTCGRRALHLVPDAHVCVVAASDIVDDVPAAIARLAPAPGERAGPLTWISGPSATSDIELNRVEGVHGPRALHVIVVRD